MNGYKNQFPENQNKNILHKSIQNNYSVEYYENQYNKDGSLKINSDLISSKFFSHNHSDKKNLYNLNKVEFQSLINLINKQEKAVKIYFNKNKLDQYNTINSSLSLLFEYKKTFLKWFSDNKI